MNHLPELVVLLAVVLLFVVTALTGRAREKYGVKAPATTGHPLFERAYRVQMNTLEQTVIFLPALWLAVRSGKPGWAGILGLIWIAGRIWYVVAYNRNPASRGPAFVTSFLMLALLILMAIWGVVRLFVLQPS